MPETVAQPTRSRALTRFRIAVTDQDIAKAQRNNSYKCVVSETIARTIPDATRIETDTQTIRFTRHGERLIFLTPYVVTGYVIAFDAGDEIHPFSFQLRDPMKVKRRHFTPAGHARHVAKVRAGRQVLKEAQRRGASIDAPEVKAAAREAAKAAYRASKAAHPGQTQVLGPGRRVTPRVFKRKARTFGMRLLRINRQSVAES
jgi:hypothetical protein